MASFQVQRKQEQADRLALTSGVRPVDLFNRAHGYNYLASILIGKAPKSKGIPDVYDSIVADVASKRRQFTFGNKRKKAKRTHTRKRDKGSSSSAMSKRYNSHLVEDCLQTAFLYYWENRDRKPWLQHHDNPDTTLRQRFTARKQSSARVTRLCCRSILLNSFKRRSIEMKANKQWSVTARRLYLDNADTLSAETLCDDLANILANGNPRLAAIVRATMAKTSKRKCLARALRCSRPTLNTRLAAITLETPVDTSSKIGTFAGQRVHSTYSRFTV